MDIWKYFTIDNLPKEHEVFDLVYKDIRWSAVLHSDGTVTGDAPLREIKLQTTLTKIFTHDKENGDQTKWMR